MTAGRHRRALARTRLRLESELACDDVVLRHGHQAAELLHVARAAHAGPPAPIVAAGLHDSELSPRIVALLDSRGRRRDSPLWHRATIVTGLIALSLVVSGMTLTPTSAAAATVAGPDVPEVAEEPTVSAARGVRPISPRMPAAASDSAIELAVLRHQPQLLQRGLPRNQYVWIAVESGGAVVASGIADRRRNDSFTTVEVGDHLTTRLPDRLAAALERNWENVQSIPQHLWFANDDQETDYAHATTARRGDRSTGSLNRTAA